MELPPRVEARNLYGKVSHEASLVSRMGPWDGRLGFGVEHGCSLITTKPREFGSIVKLDVAQKRQVFGEVMEPPPSLIETRCSRRFAAL